MPLSRLSPRSTRTRVAFQKSRQRASQQQRHVQLLAAIKKTRNEITVWQQQVEKVEQLFATRIAPLEHSLHEAVSDMTHTLVGIFDQSPLSEADQSLLGLWINDNIRSLNAHPFGDATRVANLCHQWLSVLNRGGAVEEQLARLAQQLNVAHTHSTTDPDACSSIDDSEYNDEDEDEPLLFDFGMHAKTDKHQSTNNEAFNETQEPTLDDEPRDEDNPTGKQAQDDIATESIDETVAKLEDKLSIERLFRQLAKVLHPDRELDETERLRKNALMSECIEARSKKDINALLTLYCEHVGQLPDELDANSHTQLIKALEVQLKELQQILRQHRFGDPLQALIVERYASHSDKDCQRRIDAHATTLQEEIEEVTVLIAQLESQAGLQRALAQRKAIELDKLAIDEMTGN